MPKLWNLKGKNWFKTIKSNKKDCNSLINGEKNIWSFIINKHLMFGIRQGNKDYKKKIL